MPYPEKLENLLGIKEAAEIWKISPATIQTALYQGRFHEYARKIGKSWIILPEGMLRYKKIKEIDENTCRLDNFNNFCTIENVLEMYKKGKIDADHTIKWISHVLSDLIS